jgi:hypothetical protein
MRSLSLQDRLVAAKMVFAHTRDGKVKNCMCDVIGLAKFPLVRVVVHNKVVPGEDLRTYNGNYTASRPIDVCCTEARDASW